MYHFLATAAVEAVMNIMTTRLTIIYHKIKKSKQPIAAVCWPLHPFYPSKGLKAVI